MKRVKELQPLSKEHHAALVLAKKCKESAKSGDAEKIRSLCEEVGEQFDEVLEKHFLIEEQTIFNLAAGKGGELHPVCIELEEEHQQLAVLVKGIKSGDHALLKDFGELLHDHVRTEERVLFPLVESVFSQYELAEIAKTGNI